MQFKTSVRTTRVTDVNAALGATSRLLVYSGTVPGNTAVPGGTLLVTFTLNNPVGTITNGVWTFNVTGLTATPVANGTPTFFRCIDGTTDDGTHTQIQGTCGLSGAELNFTSALSTANPATISSIVITEGNI